MAKTDGRSAPFVKHLKLPAFGAAYQLCGLARLVRRRIINGRRPRLAGISLFSRRGGLGGRRYEAGGGVFDERTRSQSPIAKGPLPFVQRFPVGRRQVGPRDMALIRGL